MPGLEARYTQKISMVTKGGGYVVAHHIHVTPTFFYSGKLLSDGIC